MKENLKFAMQTLEDAFLRLKEGIEEAKEELEKDGVIQRFEFTFELLWKTLKIFLEYEGIDVKTPRDSLKEAFRITLISDSDVFLDMLKDRNITAHIYDKETSEEIFERIKSNYSPAIEKLIEKLKER